MSSPFSDESAACGDKISVYKWTTSGRWCRFEWISKHSLVSDMEYQRGEKLSEVRAIARDFDRAAFGALSVAFRDGAYYVIDGKQRHAAAMRRSDLDELPCVVMLSNSVAHEASTFLKINTGRGPVTAVEKFNAALVADDPVALAVDRILADCDVTLRKTPRKHGETNSAAFLMRSAATDADGLKRVVRLVHDCTAVDDVPMSRDLLEGIWYIDRALYNRNRASYDKFADRVTNLGAKRIGNAIRSELVLAGVGGPRICALGILREVNRGLKHKVSLPGFEAQP